MTLKSDQHDSFHAKFDMDDIHSVQENRSVEVCVTAGQEMCQLCPLASHVTDESKSCFDLDENNYSYHKHDDFDGDDYNY